MSAAPKAYVVGSLGDDGFHIDRIYLDRDEAQRFIDAHNAVDHSYEIVEFPIVPPVEYDGPRWQAEWHEGWLVTPAAPAGDPYWFEPFWSEDVEKMLHAAINELKRERAAADV